MAAARSALRKTTTIHFKHMFTKEHPGRIDDYYQLGKSNMGEGSYGLVCKGVNKATGVERAVKIIDISRISDPSRFQQEVGIQQELDHPNIVKLHEVFKDAQKYYLVMELCTGGELFDRIVEEADKHDGMQAFDERGAAVYMRQILGAMNYLHQRQYVHRDIKPENFLLQTKAPDADLKVIDFGLATNFPAEDKEFLKTKAGTPYYVAPQVLLGNYDEKCDIWSCGVMAYILLCGFPPFYGDRDEDILRSVKRGKFDFPSPEWDTISRDAKEFIRLMLTFDPKQRPPAEKLLEHSWLQTNDSAARLGKVNKDLGNRLRAFRAASKIKKAALSVIAQQLKDEDIQELRLTFQALDTNRDGTLSPNEIREGMKRHNVKLPDDLEGIMRNLDTDGSGKIDYTEFIASTLTAKQYLKKDVMWAAFRVFDYDGDGFITSSELSKALQLVDTEVMGKMIKEADKDGDGSISFDEFCEMLEHGS